MFRINHGIDPNYRRTSVVQRSSTRRNGKTCTLPSHETLPSPQYLYTATLTQHQ